MQLNHDTLHALLDFLRARIADYYPALREPVFVVSCSSRPVGKLVKFSYHIVVQNLVFANNWDGQMRRLFTIPDTPQYDNLFVKNARGVRVSVVDTSVYTRNRLFRYTPQQVIKVY